METTKELDLVTLKTRELCQAIVDQPQFRNLRNRVESFMSDEKAKSQYQLLSEKGQHLQHKQQQGLPVSHDEIAEFESQRDAFLNNPVAKGFMEAQEEMHRVQESVQQYVNKTLELGRMPQEDDFDSSCGHGCGCH